MTENTSDTPLAQRAGEIVAAALELPPEARLLFVQNRAADDSSLLAETLSLLGLPNDPIEFMSEQAHPAMIASAEAKRRARMTPHGDALLGTQMGAYRLVRKIGAGGMGVVYAGEAMQAIEPRLVAIKFLTDDSAKLHARQHAEDRRTLMQLDHPSIARVFDIGETVTGIPYLVMEYVDGEAIDQYCAKHQVDVRTTVALLHSLCDAVQRAHQQHIVHRDIKPENVLVTERGVPKLLDFGIARSLAAPTGGRPTTVSLESARHFSPRYASPEQVVGLPESVATDIYALGVLLFELLTGQSPYRRIAAAPGVATSTVMQAVINDNFRRASVVARQARHRNAGHIDAALEAILQRATAKQSAARYQTAGELGEALLTWLESSSSAAATQPKRLPKRIAILIGIAVVTVLAVLFAMQIR